jgi:hypothetical protein
VAAVLTDELIDYSRPADHAPTFEHNLGVVDGVGDRPQIAALVDHLASAARLDPALVLLDCKRYLLTAHAYYSGQLRRRRGWSLVLAGALLFYALASLRRAPRTQSTVLVDDWDHQSRETFYGPALVDAIAARWPTEVVDVSTSREIGVRSCLAVLRRWPSLARHCRRVRDAEGVDLWHYTFRFWRDVLAGRSLRRRYGARIVLSGNDNGFPFVKAKAAGLHVLTIQNGSRGCLPDSAFAYADSHLAMASGRLRDVRTATGCQLGTVRSVGSIRLARHLAERDAAEPERYDVVFVSCMEPSPEYERVFGSYYSMATEWEAIALLNEVAEDGLRIAYYSRYDGEEDDIRARGLHSPAIEYLPRRPGGVYEAMQAGRVTICTCSTAGLEGAALGRPVGYVNLSGNAVLNPTWALDGLEYTPEREATLAQFIAAVPETAIDRRDYIVQTEAFADEVLAMVAAALA